MIAAVEGFDLGGSGDRPRERSSSRRLTAVQKRRIVEWVHRVRVAHQNVAKLAAERDSKLPDAVREATRAAGLPMAPGGEMLKAWRLGVLESINLLTEFLPEHEEWFTPGTSEPRTIADHLESLRDELSSIQGNTPRQGGGQ